MIKELRIQKDMTQEKLSELLGISLRHYVRIENESTIPRPDVFYNLINILDMDNEQIEKFVNNVLAKKNKK